MAFSSIQTANWFIDKAKQQNSELTPMKVQKLIYIAHGWHLALSGKPLISEDVQAWQYGPVVPEVFHRLKRYGKNQITDNIIEVTSDNHIEVPRIPQDDVFANALLEKVWEVYSQYGGIQLSQLTHAPSAPWSEKWNEMQTQGLSQSAIPLSSIQKYYSGLLQEETANAAQ